MAITLKMVSPLKSSDQSWLEYPDFKFKKKVIKARKALGGPFIIELFYGTERGGQINIWQKGYEKLEHVWPPSDDKKLHRTDQVNFMDYQNAVEEFNGLKNSHDVIDLMDRNS